MNMSSLQKRTLALALVLIPLVALFGYVGVRSGPLAPIAVTLAEVENKSIQPSLFGIGTVEARYRYRIGPTSAGRLLQLGVDVGDQVKAGQVLGEIEAVDLNERLQSIEHGVRKAEALLREAEERHRYASSQWERYQQLLKQKLTSDESISAKRQELGIAEAALLAAEQEIKRIRSDHRALEQLKANLRLLAPVDGLVVSRLAEPGTTLMAGQTALELIDPSQLWVNARFDQSSAEGLSSGLAGQVRLRSRPGQQQPARILRVEPLADAVTEEMLAKVAFEVTPTPIPPLGELAEVRVDLPAVAPMPTIPIAALQREGNRVGVWKVDGGQHSFTPITLGAKDLDGRVQVRSGLSAGDQVVLYSEKPLAAHNSIRVVSQLQGVQHD